MNSVRLLLLWCKAEAIAVLVPSKLPRSGPDCPLSLAKNCEASKTDVPKEPYRTKRTTGLETAF